jgi:hypothetical protein
MPDRQASRNISIKAALSGPARDNSDPREVSAIVIGVGRFRQAEIAPVEGARKDAEDFCRLLRDFGVPDGNIVSLIDETATRDNVETALRAVPFSSRKLIVYLATHGVLHEDSRRHIDGYIVLHDSWIHGKFPDAANPHLERPPTAFSAGEFLKRVHIAPPNEKLIIVDACYAGNARWEDFKNVGSGREFVTVVLCACGSRELAWGRENGRFTSALIETLHRSWERNQPFGTLAIAAEVAELLDDDPHSKTNQQLQLFCYAGEGQFWFQPPGGPPAISPEAASQIASRGWFDKAIAARALGDLGKAYRLAGKALRDSPDRSSVQAFLESVAKEIRRDDLRGLALDQIAMLLQLASSSLEKGNWEQAERCENAIREIAGSAKLAAPEPLARIRLGILGRKAQAEFEAAQKAARREALDRAWSEFQRARVEQRYEDAAALLDRIRESNPDASEIASVESALRQAWRIHNDERAAEAGRGLVLLVERRDFVGVDRLADANRHLASDYPELKRLLDLVPCWRRAWEQVIEPACALATEGKYRDAVRRLDELDEDSKSFPRLDRLRLEWQARAPVEIYRRLHWDGLYYVLLPNGLWLSQTPVTVQSFSAVMRSRGRGLNVATRQRPLEPIVGRNFRDACSYCKAVEGRLPETGVWDLAARTHPDWPYPWGHEISRELAHYAAAAICETGRYPATPRGFYDLSGNVWEWCGDALKGSLRTVHGGSFRSTPEQLRISHAEQRDAETRYDDVSFRCLLETEPRPKR